MMRALVVFESMFGNTRTIAEAIAEGLGTGFDVEVVEVADAPDRVPEGTDLVVAGGPTHAFGMSRVSTRRAAVEQGAPGDTVVATGIREWLAELRPASVPLAATFDTRVKRPALPGSAARRMARRLRRLGVPLAASAVSFWVEGTPGPLVAGERERAVRWGRELAVQLTRATETAR
jgi:hypothetical protein